MEKQKEQKKMEMRRKELEREKENESSLNSFKRAEMKREPSLLSSSSVLSSSDSEVSSERIHKKRMNYLYWILAFVALVIIFLFWAIKSDKIIKLLFVKFKSVCALCFFFLLSFPFGNFLLYTAFGSYSLVRSYGIPLNEC